MKIKIKVNKRTRTGNNKPCGLMVATVDRDCSRKQFEEASIQLRKCIDDALGGNKIVAVVVPDNMKVNFIRF